MASPRNLKTPDARLARRLGFLAETGLAGSRGGRLAMPGFVGTLSLSALPRLFVHTATVSKELAT